MLQASPNGPKQHNQQETYLLHLYQLAADGSVLLVLQETSVAAVHCAVAIRALQHLQQQDDKTKPPIQHARIHQTQWSLEVDDTEP